MPNAVTAQIGLRLTGGADALASLMQAKLFRSLSGTELDPATLRGQADLRIDFPLSLEAVPDIADLPVVMSGTLTDIAASAWSARRSSRAAASRSPTTATASA